MLVPRVRVDDSGVTVGDAPTATTGAAATTTTTTISRARPAYRTGVTVTVDGGGVATPDTPGADTPA